MIYPAAEPKKPGVSCPSRIPAAGRVLGQIVTNVDFAQTILDAAGISPHPRMQGVSFWPQLTDEPGRPTRDAMYYRYFENDDANHHAFAHYGVRTEKQRQSVAHLADEAWEGALLSAVMQFVGLALIYNLDKKTLNQMNAELKARREANAEE